MVRKTKKQKIRSAKPNTKKARIESGSSKPKPTNTYVQSETDRRLRSAVFKDLRKTAVVVVIVFVLELLVFYATLNGTLPILEKMM